MPSAYEERLRSDLAVVTAERDRLAQRLSHVRCDAVAPNGRRCTLLPFDHGGAHCSHDEIGPFGWFEDAAPNSGTSGVKT